MEKEIWKDVVDYEGLYEVSNLGRVKTAKTNKIRKLFLHKGYYHTSLSKNSVVSYKPVHRLVAQAFINSTENKPHINHKDGKKTNNVVSNLEWVTHKENMEHARRNNLISIEGINKSVSAMTKATRKPIFQILNGNIVNKFESISQANKKTNISAPHIVCVLKGKRKSAGGFQWKYAKQKKKGKCP